MKKIFTFLIIFLAKTALAQCPTTDFTLPNNGCKQENIAITNNSIGLDSLYWDFCSSDLLSVPITNSTNINELSEGWGYKIIADGNNWYSFIANRSTNSILRLDFNSSLDNEPTVTDLGNIGSSLSSPEGIDIIKNNGNWFGFIPSLNSNFGIVKLEFGNSLANTPTAINIGSFGYSGRIREVKAVEQNGDYILVNLLYESKKIARINYRDSFSNPINPENIFETNAIVDAVNSVGIELINDCGLWKAFETSVTSSKIIQINFGLDILAEPAIEASYNFTEVVNPRKINSIYENGEYYLTVANASGNMSLINFHDLDILNVPTVLDNSNFNQFIGIGTAISNGKKYIHGVNASSILNSYTFSADCGQSIEYSTEFEPLGISYSLSGTHNIELTATNSSSGYSNTISKQITISSSLAPQPSSQITGNCLSSPINFNGQQISGDITNWNWDFGDGSGTSTLQDATYTYPTTGTYQVKLSVTDANGCNNFIIDTVMVYEEPLPDFSFSGGTTLCKNNLVTFTNNSTGETGDIVTWNWDFNGEGASTVKDPTFTFLTAGTKNITLTSSISGCANVIQKTLTIIDAPTTEFSFSNTCNGQTNTFTDETTGNNLTSWNWNFGDGTTSTEQNPTHTYATPGEYEVVLTVTNNTGCFTTNQQTVINHSIPVVSFTHDLPCSTTPVRFFDQSLVDNTNIVAWEWDFGDGATSNIQHPEHLFASVGDFTVKLKAYSQFGCVDSLQTVIAVNQGPQVDFTWDKSCEGETTTFTDLTNALGTNITDWAWIIDGQLFTDQNPNFTFSNSGTYSIQLSVTVDNLCAQTLTQDIIIEVPPTVQFYFNEGCGGAATQFYDLTDQTNDPIMAREWRANGTVFSTDSLASAPLEPGNYAITLSVITAAGCEETTTNDITLIGSPVANFEVNTNYGAAPLEVSFTNNSSGGNNYLWSFGDADGSTSTDKNPTFTFSEIGIYTVTLKTSSEVDCFTETTQQIEVVAPETKATVIAITPINNADKTNFLLTIENNGTTLLDSNMNIIFRADYGTEVIESFNGIIYAGKTSNYQSSFALPSSASPANICVELVKATQLDRACIALEKSIVFSAPYPNPSKGNITVDVMLANESTIKIRVVNRSGQVLITRLIQGVTGLNEITLDGQALPQGIYIVEVIAGGKTEQFKTSIIR